MSKELRHKARLEAFENAQRIAFAPFIFQATVAARDLGILSLLGQSDEPMTIDEMVQKLELSHYGVQVLVELLACAGVLSIKDGRFTLTKTGECLIYDTMTEIHLNFANDVNYAALQYTTDAILEARPSGLRAFNESWKTIYPHLKDLPTAAQRSWFAFDHFHSDVAFKAALNVLKDEPIQTFFDIGGNTGRFTKMALQTWTQAQALFVDLPEQIALMRENPELEGYQHRIEDASINWLEPEAQIAAEKTADLIWMSQFLDCFSPEEAVSIINRAKTKLAAGGKIAILEPLWDIQRNAASALSLTAGSLYFTVLANGNSRFFSRFELETIIEKAGLEIVEIHNNLGVSHSLYLCKVV